jgi:hypothetical protein
MKEREGTNLNSETARQGQGYRTYVVSYECKKDETDERDEPEQPFDDQSTCLHH